jgi:HAD superfamily hydrolase (TIGR01450 family)
MDLHEALQGIQGFAVDLDGVIWEGSQLLPGARDFLRACESHGLPVSFVTNTVSLSRPLIIEKFRRLGVAEARLEQVFSAGSAMASYINARQPGARVHVLGQQGTKDEIAAAGLQVVEQDAAFVAIGIDRDAHFDQLKHACRLALRGAELVAANPDRWFPEEDGPVPGAGCFKAFVEWCTGREAVVVGKPNPEIFRQACAAIHLPPERVLMIGDNAEVDLGGARKTGMRCILVGKDHAAAGADAVIANLAELHPRLG